MHMRHRRTTAGSFNADKGAELGQEANAARPPDS